MICGTVWNFLVDTARKGPFKFGRSARCVALSIILRTIQIENMQVTPAPTPAPSCVDDDAAAAFASGSRQGQSEADFFVLPDDTRRISPCFATDWKQIRWFLEINGELIIWHCKESAINAPGVPEKTHRTCALSGHMRLTRYQSVMIIWIFLIFWWAGTGSYTT